VFGPFSTETYHTNSPKPKEGDLVYVLSGDKDPDQPGVDYFLEGIFEIKRRHDGPFRLPSTNNSFRNFSYRLSLKSKRAPDRPIPLRFAEWYDKDEIHNYFSSGQNFNPLPTKVPYKERFDELLAGFAQLSSDDIYEDISEIIENTSNPTERDALVKARIGQGKFRSDLVKVWQRGEKCVLTGLDVPELLVASHIKPWRESSNSERLDPMNGLLLATHADKLFDRYLMSFRTERSGCFCIINKKIRPAVGALGLKEGMPLDITLLGLDQERRLKTYLLEHLKKFEAREEQG
jgi:hypothetical protein